MFLFSPVEQGICIACVKWIKIFIYHISNFDSFSISLSLYASFRFSVNCTIFQIRAKACLKKAFCKMYVTICGRFCPDEGAVAGYG
ncbi:MAG: DUF6783 domain-containing protein, partial [Ruminococcus sp.]